MKATPTMLIKTNIEKMSLRGIAVMCMKTQEIYRYSHDVNENKRDSAGRKAESNVQCHAKMSTKWPVSRLENVDDLQTSLSRG